MNRPQVLVFVDWYRPGFKGGGPVRSMINLYEHLKDRVDLWFVTSDTDYTETAPYPGVKADQWNKLSTGEWVWYSSAQGRTMARWRALLAERAWDTVYINGMFSQWFSIAPLWCLRGSEQRRVVAPRGMLLPGPMGQGATKKRSFLWMARTAGLYRGVEFQATSEDEARSIEEWIGRDVVQHRVPNLPRKVTYAQRPERRKKAGEVKLVNVVRIATEKNIDLIIESLADVRGDVHFDLHGPIHHTAYWEKCLKLIGDLPGNVHFNYHGPVPSEKVPALFAQDHHALFMPNEGDNFGHTMLEAMCSGLPLLISDRTPWRGLAERHVGWDLPLEGAAKFTEAIQRLVAMDQTEFDRWSAGAYAYGMEQVNDPATVAANLKLFQA